MTRFRKTYIVRIYTSDFGTDNGRTAIPQIHILAVDTLNLFTGYGTQI